MTAREIYESVTNGGASDFATVVEILQRHGPWCLIGGLAVNCYVEPVYTVDADIVVALKNVDAVWTNLSAGSKAGSKLQIHFMQDERYQPFLTRAKLREVLDQIVPVADLKDIVQGKIWAWRDEERRLTKRKKDELDLIRIAETYPELRRLIPKQIVVQLGV